MKFSRGSAISNYRKNANLVNVLCFEKCAKMWILVSVPVGSKNYMQSVLLVTTFCVIELIVGFIRFLFGLFFVCWSSSFWDKCVEIFTYNCWFSYFLVIKKYIYISRLHTYIYSWLSYLIEVMFFLPVYDVPLFPCIFHHKFYNLLYFLCSWYIYHSIIIIF